MITREKIEAAIICIDKRFVAHHSTNDWGGSVWIMERKGKAFARIYWYSDDDQSVYLDCLSVSPGARNKGLGTKMQNIREKIGIDIGASCAYLFVDRNSWQKEWYKRRGYVETGENINEPNTLWMCKVLTNN